MLRCKSFVICLSLAGTIGLLGASPLQAGEAEQVLFVAPDGDDAGDGSTARPWKTIARAVKAAGPAVTINLRGGVYKEAVILAGKGGAEGRPLTIRSADGERAILDGDYKLKTGMEIRVPHVVVQGLEIRHYLQNGIMITGRTAHHVSLESNVIHHITSFLKGEGDPVRGIWALGVSDCTIRGNTIYMVIGNNESFGVLFDLASRYRQAVRGPLIERNLFYWVDKSAVRIVDNSQPDRCHVLATPAHVRGNIVVHVGYVGLEVNYVNTRINKPGPLGDREGSPVYVEDNFIGWCGHYGLNPKQSARGVSRHNTIYAVGEIGYLQSGLPSKNMSIEGNLIVDNSVGTMVHTVGEDNVFVGNYYRQPPGWPEFFWDRTNGWGTTWTELDQLRQGSALRGVEAAGILDNASRLFRNPTRGDFRLIDDCPAVRGAPDGLDFGARVDVLSHVGASGRWGLGEIPMLPQIAGLRAVDCSSEDPQPCPVNPAQHYSHRSTAVDAKKFSAGLAAHLVDGVVRTPRRPAQGRTAGWVAFELPGDRPVPLAAFAVHVCHTRSGNEDRCHPRELKLHVRDSADAPWQEAGRYVRYRRCSGRFFPIFGAPTARQVKLEVLSNHGQEGVVEFGEFRLYRAATAIE